jgi:hypothetical protein
MVGPWGEAGMNARIEDSESHAVLVQKVLRLSAKRLPGALRACLPMRITRRKNAGRYTNDRTRRRDMEMMGIRTVISCQ